MDLQQYRKHVEKEVMQNLKKAIKRDNELSEGKRRGRNYSTSTPIDEERVKEIARHILKEAMENTKRFNNKPMDIMGDANVDNLVGGSMKKPKRATKRVPQYNDYDDLSDSDSSDSDYSFKGGKFNFVKSMKSVGKDISKFGKTVKNQALGKAAKKFGNDLGDDILTTLKAAPGDIEKMMTKAPQQMVQNGEQALENGAKEATPEDVMMAAGMRKQRRTRQVGVREQNRHKLIKNLMAKHKMTLPQASKYIKEHGLKY